MGSIESVEKKEGHCYSLNRRNLNIEETANSIKSSSWGNANEMKNRSAEISIKKMSDNEISDKIDFCNEELTNEDNDCKLGEICEEEEKFIWDKVEESKCDENEGSEVERKEDKMDKKLLGSGESDIGETNEDCPIEESKNQGKGSKKGSKKKVSKKTKKVKRKKEEGNDGGNASDGDYEVEKILEVKILKNGKKEFLIQWIGFSSEYNSWEPEANLDCEDLIKEYFDEKEKVMCKSGKEETDESEGSKRKRSKVSENRKKSTGRKGRLSEVKAKKKKVTVRSNRSRMSGKGDSTTDQNERASRVTRSSQVKLTTDRGAGCKRKREEESEGSPEDSPSGRSLRGKSRKREEDQNKENFEGDEEGSDGGNGSEVSRDSGVDAAEYEVEKIVDVRRLENGSREFLIKWKGFSSKDNSWEPEKHLNCNAKVKEFLKGVEQNSSARELRFERKATDRFTLQSQRYQRKLSSRLEKMPRKSYKEVD